MRQADVIARLPRSKMPWNPEFYCCRAHRDITKEYKCRVALCRKWVPRAAGTSKVVVASLLLLSERRKLWVYRQVACSHVFSQAGAAIIASLCSFLSVVIETMLRPL